MDIMQRCLQCNSTLTPDEKKCFTCGSAVPDKNPKQGIAKRFQLVVNVLFVVLAVLTVLSLFLSTEYVPSFYKCASGLVVILFVKNSVDHMIETNNS